MYIYRDEVFDFYYRLFLFRHEELYLIYFILYEIVVGVVRVSGNSLGPVWLRCLTTSIQSQPRGRSPLLSTLSHCFRF